MIINKINPKTKEVISCLIGDKGFSKLNCITFSPVKGDKTKVLIHQDVRGVPDITINKNEVEVLCNRTGELATFKDWLKGATKQSKELQKCYRECELFFNNFLSDIKVRAEIYHDKPEDIEKMVKEKEEEKKKLEERKKLVKFYD